LDGTVASEGTLANRICKTPRVAPIMVTDGRTDSRKFRQLMRVVRQAREFGFCPHNGQKRSIFGDSLSPYSRARRVAVE
jgi:hypothetical protein